MLAKPAGTMLVRGAWLWIKRYVGLVIRYVLQAMFFLPIRKNRILLSAHNGIRYYCNPKYVSEYLAKHCGADIEIIWGFNHPKTYAHIPGIKAVRIYGIRWMYYSATAAVVITNVAFSTTQPKRKGQLFIDTWHGGGAYKRVGNGKGFAMSRREYAQIHEFVSKVDLFLSSSQAFTKFCIQQDYNYRGEVLPCGMPRNDIFFSRERRDAAARRVKAALGVTGYIAVYAPTFRGREWLRHEAGVPFPYQDVLCALEERFDSPAVILKRAHPGDVMAGEQQLGVLDVTDWPDVQELLCAADMLITDYSSCMWDFALLGRPCLLYIPDLEDYRMGQGICTPPEEWPGLICRDDRELLETIRLLDVTACTRKAEEHLRAFGSYETGTATQQVCERILQHIGLETG